MPRPTNDLSQMILLFVTQILSLSNGRKKTVLSNAFPLLPRDVGGTSRKLSSPINSVTPIDSSLILYSYITEPQEKKLSDIKHRSYTEVPELSLKFCFYQAQGLVIDSQN